MDKKSTFFIIYDPGLYGVFISWWLQHADKKIANDQLPFMSKSGSAHSTLDNKDVRHLSSIKHFQQSLREDEQKLIYLLHPPTYDVYQDRVELNYILEHILENRANNKIIFINATDCDCWIFANVATKISNNWLDVKIPELIDLKFWNITSFDQADIWQKREIIACYLGKYVPHPNSSVLSLMDSSFIKQHQNNILTVNIKDLRDDFESTLTNIAKFSGITVHPDNLSLLKQHWIETQLYINADITVKTIIDSILDEKYFKWNKLSLVEEAFVQHLLLKFGYEIRCYGLNEFPTNSTDLSKLLYRPLSDKVSQEFSDLIKFYNQEQLDLDSTLENIKKLLLTLK